MSKEIHAKFALIRQDINSMKGEAVPPVIHAVIDVLEILAIDCHRVADALEKLTRDK